MDWVCVITDRACKHYWTGKGFAPIVPGAAWTELPCWELDAAKAEVEKHRRSGCDLRLELLWIDKRRLGYAPLDYVAVNRR